MANPRRNNRRSNATNNNEVKNVYINHGTGTKVGYVLKDATCEPFGDKFLIKFTLIVKRNKDDVEYHDFSMFSSSDKLAESIYEQRFIGVDYNLVETRKKEGNKYTTFLNKNATQIYFGYHVPESQYQ